MSFLGLIAAIFLCSRMRRYWQESRAQARELGAGPDQDDRKRNRRRRYANSCGAWDWSHGWDRHRSKKAAREETPDEDEAVRARRRAFAVASFYGHAWTYGSVIGLLAFINM